jgi:hypothetical protein
MFAAAACIARLFLNFSAHVMQTATAASRNAAVMRGLRCSALIQVGETSDISLSACRVTDCGDGIMCGSGRWAPRCSFCFGWFFSKVNDIYIS